MTDTPLHHQAADAPHFAVEKIYLKDASLEAPGSVAMFLGKSEANQEVFLEYSIEKTQLSNDTYEVVLNMKVTATNEQHTIFLIEIKQAGIVLIRNVRKPERLDRLLNARCPLILLPFARESISNLVVKAGFPPLLISPLDIGAQYNQKLVVASADQSAGQ